MDYFNMNDTVFLVVCNSQNNYNFHNESLHLIFRPVFFMVVMSYVLKAFIYSLSYDEQWFCFSYRDFQIQDRIGLSPLPSHSGTHFCDRGSVQITSIFTTLNKNKKHISQSELFLGEDAAVWLGLRGAQMRITMICCI